MHRRILTAGLGLLLATTGCHTSKTGRAKQAGGDLPIASSDSVALPGSVDAADAPRAPQVAESRDATLTTYRDPATGVSFSYPSTWRPAIAGQSPVAPTFEQTAGKARVTQQFLPENTVYAETVLRALSFSYTVKEHNDASRCASLAGDAAQSAGKNVSKLYGGVPYTEASQGSSAACTSVKASVATTLRGNRCFVFERDLVTSCPYVVTQTTPRPLTAAQSAALQQLLDKIMESVRITPR